ncbi:hypothetical protein [Actinokineospora inagensis]|uniref:hypothetical protein n=1 Tax=Actinokineospora inagensis TaxID=103730 RepID=UPI0004266731|nr:hypothetical protein [Actinokineospora inagensis]
MAATLLLVTEVPVRPESVDQVQATWLTENRSQPTYTQSSVLYRAVGAPALMELTALGEPGELADQERRWRKLGGELAPALAGDFRRQLLEFVEAPKPTADPIPATEYVELRHVEVRPPAYHAYRAWRDRTIFETVRKADQVDVFLAYHSLVSTRPGVVFVSGFDCAPEEYLPVFASQEYRDILVEARDNYIIPAGGDDRGLSTTVFQRVG